MLQVPPYPKDTLLRVSNAKHLEPIAETLFKKINLFLRLINHCTGRLWIHKPFMKLTAGKDSLHGCCQATERIKKACNFFLLADLLMLKTCVLAGFSITRTTAHSCKFFPVFSAKYSTYKILTDSLQVVMEKLRLSSGPKYYLGAIDQGSSSTRFLLFDDSFKLVLSHSVPVFTESPQPGYAYFVDHFSQS